MDRKWQVSRERFNHDWLKNQYIPALESFRNILKGKVQRPNCHDDFWQVDLPQWEIRGVEVETLITEFEQSMSPCVLFEEIPLCGFDDETKEWMAVLVHALWRSRLSVAELTEHARICFESANEAYGKITSANDSRFGVSQVLDEFLNACYALASAIERLPSSVRVV